MSQPLSLTFQKLWFNQLQNFAYVEHIGFWRKLKNSNKKCLNRCQSVILQYCISDKIKFHRNAPQGTVLDPLLLNRYINDMATWVDKEIELVQYADDTVILTFGTSFAKSKAKLERNSNKLIQYFLEQQLAVNASKLKSCYLVRAKARTVLKDHYQINSIDEKPELKCLGVHIDNNLTIQGESRYFLQNWPKELKQFTQLANLSHKIFETLIKCAGMKMFALYSSCHSRIWAVSNSVPGKTVKLGVMRNIF